jgi:GntR family transcriptional regulator, histidine utilization repressor
VDQKVTFRQVKQEVLARIRANIWAPGTLLPGEIDLAAEFGCARATVSRAMRELTDEGIIERRRKAGTRVKMAPVRHVKFEIPLLRIEIESTGAAYRYALVSREVVDAPDWLRARLALPQGARVLHMECMHYADNAPFQFEDRWINLSAVPEAEAADFTAENPNEWLVRAVPFSDAAVRFSATAATEALGRFLSVSPNSPLFTVDRTTWISGQAVTNARLYHTTGYEMVALY